MDSKKPWTREDLAALRQKLDRDIAVIERENPDIRPLPPMEADEAKGLIFRLVDTAMERALTNAEANLIGQLLACFRMAIQAEMLNKRGRYFVFGEDEIMRLMNGK